MRRLGAHHGRGIDQIDAASRATLGKQFGQQPRATPDLAYRLRRQRREEVGKFLLLHGVPSHKPTTKLAEQDLGGGGMRHAREGEAAPT